MVYIMHCIACSVWGSWACFCHCCCNCSLYVLLTQTGFLLLDCSGNDFIM